ncbi:MAG: RsmB/NOP family class I SAM-dependent RNA methyltransferase [Asgard group archaeon]|nr:RsmB/NOP family class I SAM-dependent RNA methyltransferase [Asgard group archaeon]
MVSENTQMLAKKYGYLPETIERFLKLFGLEHTKAMLVAYNKKPQQSIRVNTLKTSKEKLEKRLCVKGFRLERVPFYNDGFFVKEAPFSLGATTEYLVGNYFLQSIASWLPIIALQPKPHEVILDLAAAPGGKSTHIAELMKNTGALICLDISRERIRSLRSNLSRCGIMNTILFRMDSRKFPEFDIKVNRVLLDAPCSGEGLMAIDKTRRTARSQDDILRMSQLQKELFSAAVKSLQKGGVIVYSTCSTAPEENEEVISWAMEKYPLKIIDTGFDAFQKGLTTAFDKNYHPDLTKARRLYPHTDGTEGFFFCKIELEEEL